MTAPAPAPARAPAVPRRTAAAASTPAWWRDATTVTSAATVAVVLYLWAAAGGVQQLAGGSGQALTSLGRLTGLVSADLLLLQVLLMARIPLVERSYGQDELARRHRVVGFTSFTLMVAHIVLITLGYASTAGTGALAELWELVVTYPGMLLATAGTAALVMVVGTSVRAARRRLRYESWHLLHLYAYLGVGLALPHQLWTGAAFLSSPSATVFWWSLWVAAALAVVAFRVLLPLQRTLRHRLVVEAVVRESPDTVSVVVRGQRLEELPVRAGQFFVWRFLDGAPGWTRGHPWSLSAPVSQGKLRLTVKDLGDHSARLRALRPGTRVAVEGPYGRLTAGSRTRRHVVLIGAGVGVAPLRALAEELDYAPGEAVLLQRDHDAAHQLFRDELDHLSATRGLRVVRLTGPRPSGRASFLPAAAATVPDAQALLQLAPSLPTADVYVCGPGAWMDAAVRAVLAAGVAPGRLHVERFSW